MLFKRVILILSILVLKNLKTYSQSVEKVSETKPIVMLFASYGYELPAADMAKRFGGAHIPGGGVMVAMPSNWLFGIEANGLYGSTVRENDLLATFRTSEGRIIGADGNYAIVEQNLRGFRAPVIKAGKLFPYAIGPANERSGFFAMAGLGYINHRINIIDRGLNLQQFLNEAYIRGFERRSAGPALTQSFGYLYLGPKRLINFFTAIELTQGFTSNRYYNLDTRVAKERTRLDVMMGARVGLIIPIYLRNYSQEEYFYR
jgi:hypothetical protein